jgi:hypothetical protein
MDELLEGTDSDQQSSTELSETATFYPTTSLQEEQDSSQSVLTYWETEYRKSENIDPHLNGTDDKN